MFPCIIVTKILPAGKCSSHFTEVECKPPGWDWKVRVSGLTAPGSGMSRLAFSPAPLALGRAGLRAAPQGVAAPPSPCSGDHSCLAASPNIGLGSLFVSVSVFCPTLCPPDMRVAGGHFSVPLRLGGVM